MARNYKSKDVQTKPEMAGEQNMTKHRIKLDKDKVQDDLMEKLIPLFDEGVKQRKRGTNWTPEELEISLREYFMYCAENSLKPNKTGARTWLGCSKSQYHAWQSQPEKYGAISDLINLANNIMEDQYINRGEQYPTMNVFLLRSSFGYVEKSQVDITSNGKDINSKEDVQDLVSKLGLDKPKE